MTGHGVAAPLPPGPRGHWLLGSWPALERDVLGFMVDAVARYGEAVRYRFVGNSYGYLFAHPDHLQRILQDNHRNYLKRHPTYLLLKPLLGNGLLTSDGDSWLAHRRLMQPAFHRERIARLGALMTGAAQSLVARWAAPAQTGAVVDVDREMAALAFEVVGKALFGHDLVPVVDEALMAVTDVSHNFARLMMKPLSVLALRVPFLPSARRLKSGVARLDAVVDALVAQRRAGAPGDDLLGMLLEARDADTGEGLAARQIRDEVMTLLFAGHETTAQALTWTLHLLAGHPEVEARLRDELARMLGGRTPAVEDLRAMPYLHMVVQESLRLYPPVYGFPRVVHADDVVGGYRVEAGALLTVSPYVTHRLPAFWPDPERFDPERFTPERVAARPRFAYLPFSGGARQCIGNLFALTETQLVLATLLQAYRFERVPGHVAVPEPLIAVRPRGGLPMHVLPAVPHAAAHAPAGVRAGEKI